jgi:hypothetical protein
VSHQHSHPTVSDLRGIKALKAFVAELREAFPDSPTASSGRSPKASSS